MHLYNYWYVWVWIKLDISIFAFCFYFSFLWLFLYFYACVHVYMCVQVHMNICVYVGGTRGQSWVSSSETLSTTSETGFLPSWKLASRPDWLASVCLCLLSASVTTMYHYVWCFQMSSGDRKLALILVRHFNNSVYLQASVVNFKILIFLLGYWCINSHLCGPL